MEKRTHSYVEILVHVALTTIFIYIRAMLMVTQTVI